MIIQDDNFLLYDEQIDLINKVFDPKLTFVNNWKPWYIIESFNVKDKKLNVAHLRHPLTLKNYNQSNVQITADIMQLNDKDNVCFKIFDAFCKKNNIKYERITRARINILPPSPNSFTYNNPHIDDPSDHEVFIYYFNDSDGDTVIFDQKFIENNEESNIYSINKNIFSIKKQITPKMGLGISFNGKHYHASHAPKNTAARCILNLNYKVNKK